ncbi:LysM peptidoglycan-binding domain-containing protein [Fundicoccus sp. Sow4_D5]|uniref:muramidase family protein n=1 Tax=Fundicoccus sp. Sow4_D5 TaxID=3438782 RepID=UPI003F939F1A
MIKTRQSVIERKKAMKRLDSSKKLIIRINTGLVLFSASAVLNQLTPETQSTTVYAQSNRLSPSEFLKNISGYAKDIAAKNDLYASVMIAQAALESAWGNSTLAQSPNYNLFGIKGDYNGNSIHVETLEDDGSGNYYTITDDFRKYENYDQSLGDYASLLTGDNDPSSWRYEFYSGTRYSNTESYQDATQYLTGRYATDTSYATKLNKIIEQYGLAEFDMNGNPVAPETPVEEVPANPEVSETPSTPDLPSTSVGSYTVKAGDSLYRIAANHGISLTQLMEANSLTSYFIAPNQKLVIPGGTTDNEAADTAPEESTKPEIDNPVTTHPSAPAAGGSYVVKAGDSYWAIASKYGVSIADLQKLNGTTSFLIHPGQSLKVPGTGSSTTPETNVPEATTPGNVENGTVTPPTTPSTSGAYSVKAGDSLYAIASKHGMTLSQLRELNNLSGSLIYPGQSLKVSGATTTPSTAALEVSTPETSVPTTPSTPETSTPVTSSGTYTVQRGDSLYAIATKHGMSLSQLQSLNGLSGYLIHPGQVLSVSGTAAVQTPVETIVETPETPVATPEVEVTTPVETAPVESAPSENTSSVGTHVVQAGETLYAIAQKHGVDVHKLIAINGGNNILVGQVISLN